jgi:hypothetical protein
VDTRAAVYIMFCNRMPVAQGRVFGPSPIRKDSVNIFPKVSRFCYMDFLRTEVAGGMSHEQFTFHYFYYSYLFFNWLLQSLSDLGLP